MRQDPPRLRPDDAPLCVSSLSAPVSQVKVALETVKDSEKYSRILKGDRAVNMANKGIDQGATGATPPPSSSAAVNPGSSKAAGRTAPVS